MSSDPPKQNASPQENAAAFAVADIIGSQLSAPVALLKSMLQEVRDKQGFSRVQLDAMDAAVDQAHRIAMQSQQLARLAGGRLRQSHERLGLHTVVADVVQARRGQLRTQGTQVRLGLKPVEVIVDPGLLVALCEAALDWAAEHGGNITVNLDIKNWPEHGVLLFKAGGTVRVQGDVEMAMNDSLTWHLLLQTAQAMGVSVDRFIAPDNAYVSVEFPRTVRQLEGLTAVEVDLGERDSSLVDSRPLAGYRVLLVTADARLRAETDLVCDRLGLIMDSSPTSRQATRFCELDLPHMVIVDERLRDDEFEQLREDLLRNDVNYPFVEIADEANTFEVSGWMSDSISRISRADVLKQLPSALVLEMAKIT